MRAHHRACHAQLCTLTCATRVGLRICEGFVGRYGGDGVQDHVSKCVPIRMRMAARGPNHTDLPN
jgi:hypothetical protein